MKRLALTLCLLLACAHSKEERVREIRQMAEYYPLAVGNSWTYDIEFLGQKDKQEISIVKEEKGRFTDSAGNVLLVDTYGIRDEKRYLLRTPLEVGTKWNNVVSVSSYEQYQIVEAGQDCVVPAGTFKNCVVVESRNKSDGEKTLVNTLTFAPRVGLVRIATVLDSEGKRIPQTRLELTRFKVGAGATGGAEPPAATP